MRIPQRIANHAISVWYWVALTGLIVAFPLCILPLGGGPILVTSFISAVLYVLYDWYTEEENPEEYYDGNNLL